MLRRAGWLLAFDDQVALDEAVRSAERARREHGVTFEPLDGEGLAAAEPHLMVRRAGAVHWTNAPSVADPHALVTAYARHFEAMGGRFATGDAMALSRAGEGWRVPTEEGGVEASSVVVALGAALGEADGTVRLQAAAVRQAGLPHALRVEGERRAEPSADGHGEPVHADADAGGHPADDGG